MKKPLSLARASRRVPGNRTGCRLFGFEIFLAGALSGCPGDFDVDTTTFPCRGAEDCVEGYECHPTRYVCVTAGASDGAIDDRDGVETRDGGRSGGG